MANMLVRLGLYIIALDVLFLFFAETRFDVKPYVLVQQIALAGVALLLVGIVLRVLGRASDSVGALRLGRCVVCKMKIPAGRSYCIRHAKDLEAR